MNFIHQPSLALSPLATSSVPWSLAPWSLGPWVLGPAPSRPPVQNSGSAGGGHYLTCHPTGRGSPATRDHSSLLTPSLPHHHPLHTLNHWLFTPHPRPHWPSLPHSAPCGGRLSTEECGAAVRAGEQVSRTGESRGGAGSCATVLHHPLESSAGGALSSPPCTSRPRTTCTPTTYDTTTTCTSTNLILKMSSACMF